MRLTAMTIKNFKIIDGQGERIDFASITLLLSTDNHGVRFSSDIIGSFQIISEYASHAGYLSPV